VERATVALIEIPAGWYWMGWEEGPPGERPRHRVWVDRFAIGRHPVTNREYAAFTRATGHPDPPFRSRAPFADPRQPVVGVAWPDAVAYTNWLTAVTGDLHRLPTEAEWERAARGDLAGARYPWGDDPPATHFADLRLPLPGPLPIGTGPANGFGLTDLSGNVHEWCLDWHDDAYYGVSAAANPPGPATGTRRASRGGAWRHQNPWSPVAHRSSLPPGLHYNDYGFRVVRAGRDTGRAGPGNSREAGTGGPRTIIPDTPGHR
jgi:formylglycine-generating enzyme required for sulfatase activity